MNSITKNQFNSLLPTERLNGDAIVTFHIGRGGRYHNSGHKSFAGHVDFDEVLNRRSDELFLHFENEKKILENLSLQQINESEILDGFTEACNGDFEILNKWGIDEDQLGELIHTDCNGNRVSYVTGYGTGRLDFDGQYDTTYSIKVSDCDEDELMLIVEDGAEYEDAYQYALSSLVESKVIDVEEEGEEELNG